MKFLLFLSFVTLTSYFSSATKQQDDLWNVPEKFEKMKNPVKADQASVKEGKVLYNEHCLECHGANGKGKGKKAVRLDSTPANFTTEQFQRHSDGAILYRIYFGHNEMPGFKNKIPDNKDVIEGSFGKTREPGDLINYLRTFAKKQAVK